MCHFVMDTCRWYTSMLGRKANLKEVIKELKNNEVSVTHRIATTDKTERVAC